MPGSNKPANHNSVSLDKFYEIEVQKVFEAMLAIQGLRVQVGTFFGTANLTALGIAFSTQKAGIIFLSAFLLILFLILDLTARSALIRYYYRALILQNRYASNEEGTFLDIFLPVSTEAKVRQISKISKPEGRSKALRSLLIGRASNPGFWLPLIAFFIEIFIGTILWVIFSWELF